MALAAEMKTLAALVSRFQQSQSTVERRNA
jgi:hypothetical protein